MGLLDKFKSKKEDSEKFKVTRVFDRLEQEGFKPLIKNDMLESRREELDKSIRTVLDKLNRSKKPEDMGEAVDEAMALVLNVASPWLRSMENPFLAEKVNCFIENYREWRKIPEFLDHLIEEAKVIINLSFCNIDVEPLRPIIIQSGPQYGRPRGPEDRLDELGIQMMVDKRIEERDRKRGR